MRGYAMGAVDYVFKPVEPVVLRSKVAVFVDLFTMTPRDPAQGRAGAGAARRQSARQCRAAAGRAGAAPRRAAPGGDHPVAADHPLSRAARRRAARAAVRQRQFRRGDRLRRSTRSQATPDLWADRLHPDDRERVLDGARASAATSGAMAIEYRWQCADGSYKHFLDQAVLLRDARRRRRSNMPAPCST